LSITVAVAVTIVITVAITMSKPKPPRYPEFNTQTPELRNAIATAIDAIPAHHWVRPRKNEVFANPEDAFIRIRNWGFTIGILFVKESTKKGRWQIECSCHHKETLNWRKTPVEERQRLGTHFQANNCKHSLYIS
jgi:hypothetical protein